MNSTPTDTRTPSRAAAGVRRPRPRRRRSGYERCVTQHLTLLLDGITADDYMAWVRDAEPAALGHGLHSIDARTWPLANRIELVLTWEASPPSPREAAAVAGFPPTPGAEVICSVEGGS